MKKIFAIILTLMMTMIFTACGNDNGEKKSDSNEKVEAKVANGNDVTNFNGKKILTVYFSRADENTRVGVVEKGNTKILAEMLQQMTGSDIFEIKPIKEYPKEYKETTDLAKMEKETNFRPEIIEPLPNVQDYDIIFIGYPIWWSDLPMAVYTFIEKENFNGKIIAPFCTHEGSGIGSTPDYIEQKTNAKILSGLEMRGNTAQNSRDEAKVAVENWLKKLEKEIQ